MSRPAKPTDREAVPRRSTRPPLLFPLFAPAADLPGAGPATVALLARLLGRDDPRCLDLLWHPPRGWVSREPLADLAAAVPGARVTLLAEILGHEPAAAARRPHRVLATAADSELEIVFFGLPTMALERRFRVGQRHLLHGRMTRYGPRWQMAHPESLPPVAAGGPPLALYPSVVGLHQGRLRRLVGAALERLGELPEWRPTGASGEEAPPSFASALRALHAAGSDAALTRARRRLAQDELLAMHLALGLVRRHSATPTRPPVRGDGRLQQELLARLPFRPTEDQRTALAEIQEDLAAPGARVRLLQGDVGSGKTLVALMAMLTAVEAGRQAVLMAPTELLARQHHRTLGGWAAPLGLEVGLVVGGDDAGRRGVLAALATGGLPLAVGTHALLGPEVAFAGLALAVVDEQHRFGVAQRLALARKAEAACLLLMSATPIPRSLVMAIEGDIEVSALRRKPPGREPVLTRVLPDRRLEEVVAACGRALEAGARILWICPSIVEDEEGAPGVLGRERALAERFGAAVGAAHGAQRPREREAAMRAFAEGRTRILAATTVVEVGVDVPEATVIVVEQADRFGLAQLHQLRGRVGRGSDRSACLLLYGRGLSPAGRERLRAIRHTTDGFAIAETDLGLRGPGEMLGTRQSGLPAFRLAVLPDDQPLLEAARIEAAEALAADPRLESERGRALRLLLHLFDRDETLGLVAAG